MSNLSYKEWNKEDYYNFSDEFNRIENYIFYCKKWLEYYNISIEDILIKIDWNYNDIPDLNDFNRIKNNINILLNAINSNINLLNIDSNSYNQTFDDVKANDIELRLTDILIHIGEWQFMFPITGKAISGNQNKLIAR